MRLVSNSVRGIGRDTMRLIEHAQQLLAANHPMTLRQLHYAIFSRAEIDYANDKSSYMRLSRATTTARRTYRAWELDGGPGEPPAHSIQADWMVDETRLPEMPNVWDDAPAYIDAVKHSYRRDNWQTQPHYCEVWSEKSTILGSLRPIVRKWGVVTRVCHGYGSCGQEMNTGELFEQIDKPITVFYLGDHDPSGVHMEQDIQRRVENAAGGLIDMVRLAIHQDDIAKFHLPPQKIKATDSRAAAFQRRFGDDAATVELDALPVEELRTRVTDAITGLIDAVLWDRQCAIQQVEFDCITRVADTIKNLQQLGG